MSSLSNVWDSFLRKRSRQMQTQRILAAGDGTPLVPGAGYFQLRLTEMYLQFERKIWQTYAPATLFICDFKYGSGEVRVPFFVSTQLLAGASTTNLDNTRVRFRDTRVLGPVPYVGGDVGVFSGFFRTVIKDQRKALFSIFEKLMGTSFASSLSPYVQLAEKLSDELMETLGMGDVECIIAERNVFGTSTRPLESGYLALFDVGSDALADKKFTVVDGTLHVTDPKGTRPMDLCNYCLMRTETSPTRDDITTLPFHAKWKEAQSKLLVGQAAEAKAALLECQSSILKSDDLTEAHKYQLIEFYQAAFFKDHQRFTDMSAMPGIATRGEGKNSSPEARLQVAQLVESVRHSPKPVRESVERINKLFESGVFPAAPFAIEPPTTAGTDAEWKTAINKHLTSTPPAGSDPAPQVLIKALTKAMINP